jgi:hypothetical protein
MQQKMIMPSNAKNEIKIIPPSPSLRKEQK